MPGPILVRPPRAPEADLPKQGPLTTLDKLMTVGAALAGVNEPERSQFASDEDFQQAARYYMGGTLGQLMAPLAMALKLKAEGAPLKAYHGSPHDFDQFSSAKIGTGEGAQAYAHGLYFAESEGTAGYYKEALSRQAADPREGINAIAHNWLSVPGGPRPMTAEDAAYLMDDVETLRPFRDRTDIADNIATFVNGHREVGGEVSDEGFKAMRFLDRHLPEPPKGKMYEVNLHTSPEHLLDWDKPLSQQPKKVQELARKAVDTRYGKGTFDTLSKNGADVKDLIANFDDLPTGGMEDLLQREGIHGVQYLDQGSRGHGVRYSGATGKWAATGPQGKDYFDTEQAAQAWLDKQQTRNYVIFPGQEHLIEIAKKYGVTLAVAAEMYRRATQPQMGDIGQ